MDDVSAVLLSTPTAPHHHRWVSPRPLAAIVGVNLGMGNITPPGGAPLPGRQVGNALINEMLMPTV